MGQTGKQISNLANQITTSPKSKIFLNTFYTSILFESQKSLDEKKFASWRIIFIQNNKKRKNNQTARKVFSATKAPTFSTARKHISREKNKYAKYDNNNNKFPTYDYNAIFCSSSKLIQVSTYAHTTMYILSRTCKIV
jgi:Flp pilus assembly protein TadG